MYNKINGHIRRREDLRMIHVQKDAPELSKAIGFASDSTYRINTPLALLAIIVP